MSGFMQDLRYAALTLRKNAGFTATAVLTLAIGIGANTAIFSVIDTVLLRRLPYRDPDRVVTLWQTDSRVSDSRGDASAANFIDWRAQAHSFEVMAGAEPYSFDYYGSSEPEVLYAGLVTEGFFEAIGVSPLLGRTFAAGDYQRGNQRARIWRRPLCHRTTCQFG
jgi:putative ABC transport system permease protein